METLVIVGNTYEKHISIRCTPTRWGVSDDLLRFLAIAKRYHFMLTMYDFEHSHATKAYDTLSDMLLDDV